MADYQSANFNLSAQPIAGLRRWDYSDTGPVTDVSEVAGFVSDAKAKGAKVGDLVFYQDTTRNKVYSMIFTEVQDTGSTSGTLGLNTLIGDTS